MDSVRNVIIGSGITGILAARELTRRGEEVLVVERGPLRLDADDLPLADREPELSTTAHNTEPRQGRERDPWQYGYAFGGSSLLWSGVFPRLLPADFEMRSRYGIWQDWPISYEDLLPHYQAAERLLGVAGAPHPAFPGSDAYPLEPPQPSAIDRLVSPLLQPFGALPLARHTAAPGAYPPPLGSDGPGATEPSRSILGVARELVGSEGFTVRDRTAATHLRLAGRRAQAVECVDARGERGTIRADRVIVAAHGIENAALLLRSGIDGRGVGTRLGDHVHVELEIELDEPLADRTASSRDTGISYAWADGPERGTGAGAAVIPFNPGLMVRDRLTEELVRGRGGHSVRNELRERFGRTLVVYVSLEDAPREDRRVELSARRDGLGLPLSRVSYPPDSDYVERGLERVCQGLEERLGPLGGRIVARGFGNRGGHMLGTCFMGSEGAVDENLRHHDVDNLYVAGGSAFTTHGVLHPTATIAALALRLGGHLAEAGAR